MFSVLNNIFSVQDENQQNTDFYKRRNTVFFCMESHSEAGLKQEI